MSQRSLEAFLEDAFESLAPTSSVVGRVLVDPNYIVESERSELAEELGRCVRENTPKLAGSNEGQFEIAISDSYPLIKKYLRAITLCKDPAMGSWVQVEPPANW